MTGEHPLQCDDDVLESDGLVKNRYIHFFKDGDVTRGGIACHDDGRNFCVVIFSQFFNHDIACGLLQSVVTQNAIDVVDVFQLRLPDDAQRKAVLQQQAQARGLMLKEEVMDYILHRFNRDLGSLMGLLDQLDQFALREQRAISIPLIKSMLSAPIAPA